MQACFILDTPEGYFIGIWPFTLTLNDHFFSELIFLVVLNKYIVMTDGTIVMINMIAQGQNKIGVASTI